MITYFDLLDKPYKDGERGPGMYDCYGLVMEMFRRAGCIISDYPTRSTCEANTRAFLEAAAHDWIKIPAATPHCAVTLLLPDPSSRGDHIHIGFMLDQHEFIHTLRGRGVGVDDIRHAQWEKRIYGFYKWSGAK